MEDFVKLVNELNRIVKNYPPDEATKKILTIGAKSDVKIIALTHLLSIYCGIVKAQGGEKAIEEFVKGGEK